MHMQIQLSHDKAEFCEHFLNHLAVLSILIRGSISEYWSLVCTVSFLTTMDTAKDVFTGDSTAHESNVLNFNFFLSFFSLSLIYRYSR